MELFYILLVLLLATRLFGEIFARFGQPVLAGELLAGVLLGVVVKSNEAWFPVLSELTDNHVFDAITDLGIFFLMLLAGVELRPRDISRAPGPALAVALGGMLLPMSLGLGLGYVSFPASDWKIPQMLYVGVALSVTAVPITIATLIQLDKHRSRVGSVIISAAVFDDLLSLFLLAVLTSLLGQDASFDIVSLVWLTGKVLLFFAITAAAGRWLFPWLGNLAEQRLQTKHVEFTMLMTWALAFSVLAELLAMHFVLGAFAAGLFFTRRTIDEAVHREVHVQVEAVTLGFFAPIFFASIGLNIDLRAMIAVPGFVLALITAAFLGKLFGAGFAAWCAGVSRRDAVAIGVGMNARGAVELIIAGIALRAGLFSHPDPPPPVIANLFSAVVLMAVLAAVISPLALRALVSPKAEGSTAA